VCFWTHVRSIYSTHVSDRCTVPCCMLVHSVYSKCSVLPLNPQVLCATFPIPLTFCRTSVRILIRTAVQCATVLLALFVPSYPLLLELVSSVTNTFAVFLLPALFYWKMFRERISALEVPRPHYPSSYSQFMTLFSFSRYCSHLPNGKVRSSLRTPYS
jgi:transmembrane amino acid transporter